MSKDLIIDILCYLRNQSKYDREAMELFDILMDEVNVTYNKEG